MVGATAVIAVIAVDIAASGDSAAMAVTAASVEAITEDIPEDGVTAPLAPLSPQPLRRDSTYRPDISTTLAEVECWCPM